ncbi:MAG: hypothetical protein Q7T01_01905 [bacterium]|nr:hypothetical protein [bacterium]
MDVAMLPVGEYQHYQGSMRMHVRMIEGDVPRKHIRFVILRLPRAAFPEAHMIDAELDNEDLTHISRLYQFTSVST